ncbi:MULTISPECIES: hypothetical protein [Haloferax]|uniref:hypothetical protein n=1 Tax=Haloferax TaxID=2251 RepID=UPI0011C01A73|nr:MULTISPECIES: hypothetical protein [Haloferax]
MAAALDNAKNAIVRFIDNLSAKVDNEKATMNRETLIFLFKWKLILEALLECDFLNQQYEKTIKMGAIAYRPLIRKLSLFRYHNRIVPIATLAGRAIKSNRAV